MPVAFQVAAVVLGLALTVIVGYALYYIAEDFEETALWPVARIIKGIIGGLIWSVFGLLVAAGLFVVAIVLRVIFFRPVFSFYVMQIWAINLGLVLIAFYMVWGIYHGARNRLPGSFRFRR